MEKSAPMRRHVSPFPAATRFPSQLSSDQTKHPGWLCCSLRVIKKGFGGGMAFRGRVGRSVLMRELMKTQGVIRQFWDGWEYVGQVTSTWNPKQPV